MNQRATKRLEEISKEISSVYGEQERAVLVTFCTLYSTTTTYQTGEPPVQGVDYMVVPYNEDIHTLDADAEPARKSITKVCQLFSITKDKFRDIVKACSEHTKTHNDLLKSLFDKAKQLLHVHDVTLDDLPHVLKNINWHISSLFARSVKRKTKQSTLDFKKLLETGADADAQNNVQKLIDEVVAPPPAKKQKLDVRRKLIVSDDDYDVPKESVDRTNLRRRWDDNNQYDQVAADKFQKLGVARLPEYLIRWKADFEDRCKKDKPYVERVWDDFVATCVSLHNQLPTFDIAIIRALVANTIKNIEIADVMAGSPQNLIDQLSQSQKSPEQNHRIDIDNLLSPFNEHSNVRISPRKRYAGLGNFERTRSEIQLSQARVQQNTPNNLISYSGDPRRSLASIGDLGSILEDVPRASQQYKRFYLVVAHATTVSKLLTTRFETTFVEYNSGLSVTGKPPTRLRRQKNAYWSVMELEYAASITIADDLIVEGGSKLFLAGIYCPHRVGALLGIAMDIEDYLIDIMGVTATEMQYILFAPIKCADEDVWRRVVQNICENMTLHSLGGSIGMNADNNFFKKCADAVSKAEGAAFQHLVTYCQSINVDNEDDVYNEMKRIYDGSTKADSGVTLAVKTFFAQNQHITQVVSSAAKTLQWLANKRQPFLFKNRGRVAVKLAIQLYDAIFNKIGNFLDPTYCLDDYNIERLGDVEQRGKLSSSLVFYTFVDLMTKPTNVIYLLLRNHVNTNEFYNKVITQIAIAKTRNRHLLFTGDQGTGKSILGSCLKSVFDGTSIILENDSSVDWVLAEPNDSIDGLVLIEDVSYKKLDQYRVKLRTGIDGSVILSKKIFAKCKKLKWPPVLTITNVPERGPPKPPLTYVYDVLDAWDQSDLIDKLPEYSAKKENITDSRLLVRRYCAITMNVKLNKDSKFIEKLEEDAGLAFLWSRSFPDCHAAYGMQPTMWSPCRGDPKNFRNHHPGCRLIWRSYYQRKCLPTSCDAWDCDHVRCRTTQRVRKELLGHFFDLQAIENVRQAMYYKMQLPENNQIMTEDDNSKKRMIDKFVNDVWAPICVYATKCTAFSEAEEKAQYKNISIPLQDLIEIRDESVLFAPAKQYILLDDLDRHESNIAIASAIRSLMKSNSDFDNVGDAFVSVMLLSYSNDETPYGKLINGLAEANDLFVKRDVDEISDMAWRDIADSIFKYVYEKISLTVFDIFLYQLIVHDNAGEPVDKRRPQLKQFVKRTQMMQKIKLRSDISPSDKLSAVTKIKEGIVNDLWSDAVGLESDCNERSFRTNPDDKDNKEKEEELYC